MTMNPLRVSDKILLSISRNITRADQILETLTTKRDGSA